MLKSIKLTVKDSLIYGFGNIAVMLVGLVLDPPVHRPEIFHYRGIRNNRDTRYHQNRTDNIPDLFAAQQLLQMVLGQGSQG